MFAHLLLEEADRNSKSYQDLVTIAQEADRCKKIVSGLLNFARKNKVVLSNTNVCEMIDQALRVIQIPGNIEVVTGHEKDSLFASLDRDQVIQVINNIINNAVTAMPGGGRLIVSTKDHGEYFRIIISDSGCGIPEKNIAKIFDPFFTTKTIGKGTGLGLAISYGIVKMHRGRIEVESNANPEAGPTGTTFNLIFPKNGGEIVYSE
jgi:signal transduction histidine kinase